MILDTKSSAKLRKSFEFWLMKRLFLSKLREKSVGGLYAMSKNIVRKTIFQVNVCEIKKNILILQSIL